jgi:hypothetical protein
VAQTSSCNQLAIQQHTLKTVSCSTPIRRGFTQQAKRDNEAAAANLTGFIMNMFISIVEPIVNSRAETLEL